MGAVVVARVVRVVSVSLVLALVAAVIPAGGVPAVAQTPGGASVPGEVNTEVVGGAPPAAAARDVRPVREVAELATAETTTFAMSDGSYVTEMAPAPVNFEDAGGDWRPIDPTLRPAREGWRTAASDVVSTLPASLAADPVRVDTDAGVLSIATVNAKAAAGVLDAESSMAVTYAEVADGVDAVWESRTDGVKESLILDSPDAQREFVYRLTTSKGLRVALSDGGDVQVVDGSGEVVLSMWAPFMVDARGVDVEEAVSFDIDVDLQRDGDGWLLTVSPDGEWLDDPSRVWPVTVDPTFSKDAVRDCEIGSDGGANHQRCQTWGSHRVGRFDSGGKARMLLHFKAWEQLGEAARGGPLTIRHAELGLRFANGDESQNFKMRVRRLTEYFSNHATWNDRQAGTAWATAGGTFEPIDHSSYGWLDDGDSDIWRQDDGWKYWFPTEAVERWWNEEGVPEAGFLVQAQNESTYQIASFNSVENSNPDNWPRLRVQWARGGKRPAQTTIDRQLSDRATVGVDVGSGNGLWQFEDVRVNSVLEHPLVVRRSFNTLGVSLPGDGSADDLPDIGEQTGGDFGVGWFSTVDSGHRIRGFDDNDRRVSYVDETGRTVVYLDGNGDGDYDALQRTNDTLTRNPDDTYELERNSGETLFFTAEGKLRFHDDRSENRITYNYDSSGRVASVTDTQGRVTTITRNGSGLVTKIADPASRQHLYGYTGGQLTSYTDPEGATYTYRYNTHGQLDQVSLTVGGVTQATELTFHNSGGTGDYADWVHKLRRKTGSTTWADDVFVYARNGSASHGKTTYTDPVGNDTTYEWDRAGRVTKTTDAKNNEQSTTYDSNDNVVDFTDRGSSTVNTYTTDGLNNLKSVELPTGAKSNFEYNDPFNRFSPSKITPAQGGARLQSYDSFGRPDISSDNQTQCTNGCEVDIDWIADGRVDKLTNQRGKVTDYTWTGYTKLVIDPPGPSSLGSTTVDYDSLSRVATITQGSGATITYTYDDLDRPVSVDYSGAAATVTMVYDEAGNMTAQSDGTGTKTIDYDRLNRVVSEVLPGGRGTTTYAYDDAGNLTSMTDPSGTTTYTYEALNRVATLVEPGNHTTSWSYDDGNRKQTVTYPNGVVQVTQFDAANRVTTITGKRASSGPLLTEFAYDYTDGTADTMLRQRITVKRRTTSGSTETRVTEYDYDNVDRLVDATVTSGPGSDTSYSYDATYNRTQATEGSTTTTYSYDDANQLTSSTTGGSTTTYSYDGNGDLVSASDGLDFDYDTSRATTSMKIDSSSSAYTAEYAGRNQFERTELGSTQFVDTLLGTSHRDDGPDEQAYRRTPDGNLVGVTDNGDRHYYLTDAQGTVAAVTDDAGKVTNRYDYSPYGETSEIAGAAESGATAISQPYRYTGQYQDPTGLYKMGIRYYHPELARWTQQDPAYNRTNLPAGNLYAYTGCNPTNRIDPTGAISVARLVAEGVYYSASTATCGALGYAAGATTLNPAVAVGAYVGCQVTAFVVDEYLLGPALDAKYGPQFNPFDLA